MFHEACIQLKRLQGAGAPRELQDLLVRMCRMSHWTLTRTFQRSKPGRKDVKVFTLAQHSISAIFRPPTLNQPSVKFVK